MISGKKVGVIIPAYNEESFILFTLKEVPKGVDIIVCVDDASTDDTYSIMNDASSKDKRIVVVRSAKNSGIGSAFKLGFTHLADKVDYVCVLPGDNQCDGTLIEKFIFECDIQDADCCKGNRFVGGNDISQMPKHRKVGNLVYSYIMKVVSGYYSMFDSQHGFCAIRTRVLLNAGINQIREDYLFDNSLWVVLNSQKSKVVEIQSSARYQGEVSDINYRKFIVATIFYFPRAFIWRLQMRYGYINSILMCIIFSLVFIYSGIIFRDIFLIIWGLALIGWAIFLDYWGDPNAIFTRS